MQNKIADYTNLLNTMTADKICSWAIKEFGVKNIALATSLSAEDQVLTDMLLKINPKAQIFTLDTGRLPGETYATIDQTNKKYGCRIEILFPDARAVSEMESTYGPNLFYASIENRQLCCRIRKVEVLKKKLKTLQAWMTGLRKEQALTRRNLPIIEWDEASSLIKINPLVDWTEKQVWDYIKTNQVPYNKLHDQGYPSIGCAPCTRPIKPGEDLRAGRWWWELPEQKECGLHIKEGRAVRGGEN